VLDEEQIVENARSRQQADALTTAAGTLRRDEAHMKRKYRPALIIADIEAANREQSGE
jgi:hypothetical protein